jgi:hypothetical protein
MKTSRLFPQLILLFLAIALLTSGCGAPGAAKVTLQEVETYWASTVAIENRAEADWLAMLTRRSEGLQNLKNQYPLIDVCFTGVQAMEDVVTGRYDKRTEDGQPTGVVDPQLMINAQLVNENYPDQTVCQELVFKIASDTTAWRLGNIDAFNKIWDDKEDLDRKYFGELNAALVNQLLQYAGTEFMKTDLATHFAPPKVWFPTFNLEAFVTDETQCGYFTEDFPGQARWVRSTNRCQLIGQAAYMIIFQGIFAPEIFNEVNTGVDQSEPFPTTAP